MINEIKLIESLLKASAERLRSMRLLLKASEVSELCSPLPKRIHLRKKEEELEYENLIGDLNLSIAEALGEELILFRKMELPKTLFSQEKNALHPTLKLSESLSLLLQGRAVPSRN